MVAARLYARKALDLGRQWGSTDIIHSALHSSAMPLIFARDFDRVLEIIEEMKLLYIPTGRYPRFPVVVESLARLHMRDFSGAVHCVNDVLSHTDSEWCMERLMPVYIALFRQGFRSSLDDVLDFITSFLPLCEAVDCPSGRVHALICRAMALEALGRGVEAGDFLKQALTIAEPEGYIRSIIDFGVPMQTLLVSVQEADRKLPDKTSQRRIEYTGRLLAILGEEISTGKPAVPSSPDLVEQLSSRELEVLKLLAQGCSDKQIAATLVIARETVHKHLKNIYGKLGVHNRTEAASRAHQLGLL
jgi:LuxR family maltose regulon positive regulatory protein